MDKPVVALVDSPTDLHQALSHILAPHSFKLFQTESTPGLLERLRQEESKLAIIATATAGAAGGLQAAARIRRADHTLPLILIVAQSSEDQAVAALRVGVNDYLRWPCADAELLASVRRTLVSASAWGLRWHRPPTPKPSAGHALIGQSESVRQIRDYLRSTSLSDSNVLITGETGTGKERVAQQIHAYSRRQDKRLICINCAAVPDSLLESELFGYERGAFTGANAAYEGKLRLADGGTIFFDEIGDMSLFAQAKILRAIESKAVYRLGGKKAMSSDFRIIAATNRDLEAMMAQGSVRRDLYYRLNVARIDIPPLRERKEDLPHLIRHHLGELNACFGTDVLGFDGPVLELLLKYDWPGNVRELHNIMEAAFINRPQRWIRLPDLPAPYQRLVVGDGSTRTAASGREREALVAALLSTDWNKSKAAQRLHWSRMTVYRKMKKYHIEEDTER